MAYATVNEANAIAYVRRRMQLFFLAYICLLEGSSYHIDKGMLVVMLIFCQLFISSVSIKNVALGRSPQYIQDLPLVPQNLQLKLSKLGTGSGSLSLS